MQTLMALETSEAPERCLRRPGLNGELVRRIGRRLRELAPTLAHGSSDHATSFAKMLIETRAELPALSHWPVDEAREGPRQRLDDFAGRGARFLAAGMADAPAIVRGRNPDLPPQLAKVTQTL